MDDQKMIIALLMVIIAILVVGVVVFSPLMAKEDSNIVIASNKLSVGESMVVKLTDNSGNPIPDGKITVKLTDENGKAVEDEITTNSKGNAKLKMQEKGTYSVECSFGGNDKFASSSTAGHLTVKKATTKVVDEQKSSNYDSVSGLSNDGYSYYPDSGPAVDSMGQSREYAKANNMHYVPQTIDGRDAGLYVRYDSKAGCYHT